jgi:hypothetical protein
MAVYTDYLMAAIIYNIQILPDTVMCGLIILAVVLANPTVITLAGGTALAQLLTSAVGRLVMKYQPESTVLSSSMSSCQTSIIGKTWERLLRGTRDSSLLYNPLAPSIFQATIGFLVGWGAALQQLYKEEINAGVLNRKTSIGLGIVALLVAVLSVIFRVSSGCESITAAIAGLLFGGALGYFGAITIGYATDRRLTNIYGIPLLRDRINNGSAVYICPT